MSSPKTATEVEFENKSKRQIKALLDEFHEVWEKMGEPHPSSNAYLDLNRAFFYRKGMETAIRLNAEMEAISAKKA